MKKKLKQKFRSNFKKKLHNGCCHDWLHSVCAWWLKIVLVLMLMFAIVHKTSQSFADVVRDNDNFLSNEFWSQNPTTGEIVAAIFGSGSGDETAYTKNWTGWDYSCNGGNVDVQTIVLGTTGDIYLTGEKTIYVIDQGTYTFTDHVTYHLGECNVLLGKGIGTEIIGLSTAQVSIIGRGKNIVIDNIEIDGDGNMQDRTMFDFSGQNISINNIYGNASSTVEGGGVIGVLLKGSYISINNSRVGAVADGFVFSEITNSHISNITCESTLSDMCFNFTNASGNSITNILADGANTYGLYVFNSNYNTFSNFTGRNNIDNNIVLSNSSHNTFTKINLPNGGENSNDISIENGGYNNFFDTSIYSDIGAYSVYLNSTSNNVFSGFMSNTNLGFHLDGSHNNEIKNCSLGIVVALADGNAIYIQNSNNTKIQNCSIEESRTPGSYVNGIGAYNASGTVISGVNIDGMSQFGIYVNSGYNTQIVSTTTNNSDGGDGIVIMYSYNSMLKNITATNHFGASMQNTYTYDVRSNGGIYIYGGGGNVLLENIYLGNNGYQGVDVSIQTGHLLMSGVVADGNDRGIAASMRNTSGAIEIYNSYMYGCYEGYCLDIGLNRGIFTGKNISSVGGYGAWIHDWNYPMLTKVFLEDSSFTDSDNDIGLSIMSTNGLIRNIHIKENGNNVNRNNSAIMIYGNNNVIENIKTHDNYVGGLHIDGNYNTINNIISFNNGKNISNEYHGISIFGSGNVINNSAIFNNGGRDYYGGGAGNGIDNNGIGTVINNVLSYNNGAKGINSNSTIIFHNVSLFNNIEGGALYDGNRPLLRYYGNLYASFNDPDAGGYYDIYANLSAQTGNQILGRTEGKLGGFSNNGSHVINPQGFFPSCNIRNFLGIQSANEGLFFSYGSNVPKQIQPVRYNPTTKILENATDISWNSNDYIAQFDVSTSPRTCTPSNTNMGGQDITWNNDNYINTGFWLQGPNASSLIKALYGTSSDLDTAYTQNWNTNTCDSELLEVVYFPTADDVFFGPNVNGTITTSENTIYVLNSNITHQTKGTIGIHNCTAIIGSGANRNVGPAISAYGDDFIDQKGFFLNGINNIIDGLYILNDGYNVSETVVIGTSGNNTLHNNRFYDGQNGGYVLSLANSVYNTFHTLDISCPSSNSCTNIYLNGSYNTIENIYGHEANSSNIVIPAGANYNTIKNSSGYYNGYYAIEVWGNNNTVDGYLSDQDYYGVYVGGNNNIIKNSTSKQTQSDDGFEIGGNDNLIENSVAYNNNSSAGFYFYGERNILNNISSFNNYDGIYIAGTNTLLNNILVANNYNNGIYMGNGQYNTINNAQIQHNGNCGISNNANYNTINNTLTYNNYYGLCLYSDLGTNNVSIYNNEYDFDTYGNNLEYYGQLKIFENINENSSSVTFNQGSTNPSLGRNQGLIYTGDTVSLNTISNISQSNIYMRPWNDILNNRTYNYSRYLDYNAPIKVSYGRDIPYQQAPVQYNGSILEIYGNTGVDRSPYRQLGATLASQDIVISIPNEGYRTMDIEISINGTGSFTVEGDVASLVTGNLVDGSNTITLPLSAGTGEKTFFIQITKDPYHVFHYLTGTTREKAPVPSLTITKISNGLTGERDGQLYFKGSIDIEALVQNNGDGIDSNSCEYTLDGSDWNSASYNSGKCYKNNLSPNTGINIQFKVSDLENGEGSGEIVTYLLDEESPTVPTIVTPISGTIVNQSTINLSWTSSTDSGVGLSGYGYEISTNINFGSIVWSGKTINTGISISGLPDDTYYLRVFAYDIFENQSSMSEIIDISIDAQNPTMSGVVVVSGTMIGIGNTGYIHESIGVEVQVSDNGVGIDTNSCKYTVDGNVWQIATYDNGVCKANVDAVGTNFLQFVVSDLAGNTITGSVYVVIEDTTGPTAPILVSPLANEKFYTGNVDLIWLPSQDTGAGMSYYIYQIASDVGFTNVVISGTTTSLGVSLENLSTGMYYWKIAGVDAFSNQGVRSSSHVFEANATSGAISTGTVNTGIVQKPVVKSSQSVVLAKDYCPDGDRSSSYYDGDCGDVIETAFGKVGKTHASAPVMNQLLRSVETSPYSQEVTEAYVWAYDKGITTVSTIQSAKIDQPIIRKHLAKMMVNFALMSENKEANTGKNCRFSDTQKENVEMRAYTVLACQFGLMGLEPDGVTPKTTFNPNAFVTRAEFGTILSRMLFGTEYASPINSTDRWTKHLEALKKYQIMKKIDEPRMEELRGYVMLMLYRTENK